MIIEPFLKNGSRESFRISYIIYSISKINLFLFSPKQEAPYKSTSFLLFSGRGSKLWQTHFTLLIGSIGWCLK